MFGGGENASYWGCGEGQHLRKRFPVAGYRAVSEYQQGEVYMCQDEIGFGVLGLGMGTHHALAVSEVPGVKLVAVCDQDPMRMQPTAEKYGCRGYLSFEEMLSDPEIQAVTVATESGKHAECALMAIAAGKHVLVEKPADVKVERIDEMIEAAKRAGVKVTSVFQSRTLPLNRCIKNAVDEGRFGKLVGVHALVPWYREQSYYEGPHGDWKGTWALDGGGSLANQGVHTVDLLQFLVGRVKSVFGAFGVYAHDVEAEDTTTALLKFENGALGTISTATSAYPGMATSVTILGWNGSVQKQDDVLHVWKFRDETEEDEEIRKRYGPGDKSHVGVSSDPNALGAYGNHGHIAYLAKCIREGCDPFITLESARHAVEIVNAIYESGRTGKEVFLS